jgi:hypothetical protein
MEFRTEAFNVMNTAQFTYPNATLSYSSYPTPISAFGTVTSTANAYNPRLVQFAARVKF